MTTGPLIDSHSISPLTFVTFFMLVKPLVIGKYMSQLKNHSVSGEVQSGFTQPWPDLLDGHIYHGSYYRST